MEDMNLKEQLIRFSMLWHRYAQYKRGGHGAYGDVHRGQGRVLSILKMKPEISQKELSYLLDMRAQSLGELLAKLEKKEFITRTPSDADRRAMLITLTEKGKEAANQPREDDFEKIIGCLNESEQKNLSEYLDKLTKEIKKSFDEKHFDGADMGDDRMELFRKMHGHMGRMHHNHRMHECNSKGHLKDELDD